VRGEDVTIGFIAWAIGGVIGALPAGAIGVRIGRRRAMLLGFGLMLACLVALDRVARVAHAVPLLALASASWTLPTVNAFPLFIEGTPRYARGVLAALFLLCMALGGVVGDPLNGGLFDLADGYRPLFLMMAGYTALAFGAVLLVPRGTGEADTGPDATRGPGEAGHYEHGGPAKAGHYDTDTTTRRSGEAGHFETTTEPETTTH
jgi:MFS family permease